MILDCFISNVKCDITVMKNQYMNVNSVCLSHKEDPDGIISAALIKQFFNSKIFLTDYSDLINTLQTIIKNYTFEQIFICDLALKLANIDQFLKLLHTIKQNGAEIWLIDHHPLSEEMKKKCEEINVKILYSEMDCTSAIIYENFTANLKKNSELLVSCACITDGRENGPLAKKIIKKHEKMFTLLNAALIWYDVKKNQKSIKKLLKIVDSLTLGKLPFEIVSELHKFHDLLHEESKFNEYIENNTKFYKNFDYLKIHGSNLSNYATRIMNKSEKTVCLVHRDFDKGTAQELVILSTKENHKNVGLIINQLSTKFHGSGGGDPQRAAAIIPTENFERFLQSLDLELARD